MFGNALLLQYDIITENSEACHLQGYAANTSQGDCGEKLCCITKPQMENGIQYTLLFDIQ